MAIIVNPISPVAVSLFGFDLRWYALAYVAAFVVGFFILKKLNDVGARRDAPRATHESPLRKKQFDDLFTYIIVGVILGGRLGYVLFYNLPYFIENPLEIFMVWHGGMSFHGGMLGVIAAVFLFSEFKLSERRAKSADANSYKLEDDKTSNSELETSSLCALRSTLSILDMLAVVAPIGLFFGRIANFINMELMGRPTDGPLGVIFAGGDGIARYPTPLFEAAGEGALLFLLMFCLWRFTGLRKHAGALSGVFGMGYATARIFVEFFRAPDAQLGYLLGTSWLTMGMILSGVMFVAAAGLFAWAMKRIGDFQVCK